MKGLIKPHDFAKQILFADHAHIIIKTKK